MRSTLSWLFGHFEIVGPQAHDRSIGRDSLATGQQPELVVQFGQRRTIGKQRVLMCVRKFGPSPESNVGFALVDNSWRNGRSGPDGIKHCEVAAQPERIVQKLMEQLGSRRAFKSFYFTTRLFKKLND